MIVSPTLNEKAVGSNVKIARWTWSGNGINEVEVGANGDELGSRRCVVA
jgi:hypothetical protein